MKDECRIIREIYDNNEKNNIDEIFCCMSKELFSRVFEIEHKKTSRKFKFSLKEIEFYLFDVNKHEDHYVHCNKKQKGDENCGLFYVHSKGGNYGGIDISLAGEKYFFGVLIRGIEVENTNGIKYIAGPNRVKKYFILSLNVIKDSQDFKEHEILQNILDNEVEIFVERADDPEEIYKGERIGLSFFEEKEDDYLYANYRFVAHDYLFGNKDDFEARSNLKKIDKLKKNSCDIREKNPCEEE